MTLPLVVSAIAASLRLSPPAVWAGSASGTFANQFAILHPQVVRAVACGGVNGIPTFPVARWQNTTLPLIRP